MTSPLHHGAVVWVHKAADHGQYAKMQLHLLHMCNKWSCIFAYLQSGPVSIEVQRWFSLRCIVPKILTFNKGLDFAGFCT